MVRLVDGSIRTSRHFSARANMSYNKALQEYAELGHAQPVPVNELNKPESSVYYFPSPHMMLSNSPALPPSSGWYLMP